MQSVGEILAQERIKQGKTILQIHYLTRMPEKTIIALEKNDFSNLPATTFIKGFIKIYSQALGLNDKQTLAIFRRDWRKKEKTKIIPPNLSQNFNKPGFFFGGNLGLILGSLLLLLALTCYLGWQVKNYFSSPKLVLDKPQENEELTTKQIVVEGKTNPEITVMVNGNLVNLDDKGNFVYEYQGITGENKLEVKATNRRNKETSITRKVQVIDKED